MCCITMVAPDVTMATTQLTHASNCKVCCARQAEERTKFRPPRVSWVVVTDRNQPRRAQMRWTPSADDR